MIRFGGRRAIDYRPVRHFRQTLPLWPDMLSNRVGGDAIEARLTALDGLLGDDMTGFSRDIPGRVLPALRNRPAQGHRGRAPGGRRGGRTTGSRRSRVPLDQRLPHRHPADLRRRRRPPRQRRPEGRGVARRLAWLHPTRLRRPGHLDRGASHHRLEGRRPRRHHQRGPRLRRLPRTRARGTRRLANESRTNRVGVSGPHRLDPAPRTSTRTGHRWSTTGIASGICWPRRWRTTAPAATPSCANTDDAGCGNRPGTPPAARFRSGSPLGESTI